MDTTKKYPFFIVNSYKGMKKMLYMLPSGQNFMKRNRTKENPRFQKETGKMIFIDPAYRYDECQGD